MGTSRGRCYSEETMRSRKVGMGGRMRVIGGELGGRRLKAPVGPGTRPTLDRVREALFNIVAGQVPGARVLDLYAGTGALAIEALSRGAGAAVLVDRDRRASAVARANLQALGLDGRTRLLTMDAERALGKLAGQVFDLVFLDPPWPAGIAGAVVDKLPTLVSPGGMVVVEYEYGEAPLSGRAGVDAWAGLKAVDRRRYGRTGVVLWRLVGPDR